MRERGRGPFWQEDTFLIGCHARLIGGETPDRLALCRGLPAGAGVPPQWEIAGFHASVRDYIAIFRVLDKFRKIINMRLW